MKSSNKQMDAYLLISLAAAVELKKLTLQIVKRAWTLRWLQYEVIF